jgi:hypothetical protein
VSYKGTGLTEQQYAEIAKSYEYQQGYSYYMKQNRMFEQGMIDQSPTLIDNPYSWARMSKNLAWRWGYMDAEEDYERRL